MSFNFVMNNYCVKLMLISDITIIQNFIPRANPYFLLLNLIGIQSVPFCESGQIKILEDFKLLR